MNKEELKQAQSDMKLAVESTKELIDMPFFEVATFFEGKNVGELRGYRTLLTAHLNEVDVTGANLVKSKVLTFTEDERVKLGSVFMLANKIQNIIGYIDYLYKKNSIK
ncbi:hypothetical protein F400_gp120 [Bacillus phage BCD7]|uniref:Uncharacterized protein n=1 Tax=Bacillus phage BCD7 TaxID=1136534 RepID=J9PUE4_9CAUD|nr:hypothetical protein F400_gp120 [Bacillus phage BCD7]AEZ50567.1 hypothetical protein BCD7_0120 [Bacillus phage BCD7]